MTEAQAEYETAATPSAEGLVVRAKVGAGVGFYLLFFPEEDTGGRTYEALWPLAIDDDAARTENPAFAPSAQSEPEGSTVRERTAVQDRVYDLLAHAFARACDESFDDEAETEFAREIRQLVRKYADRAVEAAAHLILFGRTGAQLANEALCVLGMIQDVRTLQYRRWLLERSLRATSAVVRDGAVLGLSWLDDPHAIPFVERARERERIAPLRRSMEKLLDQLRGEPRWHIC